ncbi:MAG TPA: hypothetical protein VFC85_03400 [Verrucomicrobiae bacterium]|nr:hypothetical protein [Verrucomicrobiae bacterium]
MENTTVSFFSNTPPSRKLLTYRQTAAKILALETQLCLAPSKPILNIWRANERVGELESMVAARAKSAASVVATPVAAPVAEKFGRERFNASCAADAAAKPKSQNHPELRGRERFSAAARVDSTQILSAPGTTATAGAKSEKTGRARFAAAVKKSN